MTGVKGPRLCDHGSTCLTEYRDRWEYGTKGAKFKVMEAVNGVTGKPSYLCYECMRTAQIEYGHPSGEEKKALVISPLPKEDQYVDLPTTCP